MEIFIINYWNDVRNHGLPFGRRLAQHPHADGNRGVLGAVSREQRHRERRHLRQARLLVKRMRSLNGILQRYMPPIVMVVTGAILVTRTLDLFSLTVDWVSIALLALLVLLPYTPD